VITGFHHSAYRCRDSEETRAFYEDFLGCPLVAALPVSRSFTGRPIQVLHTYFALGDGCYIAFFEDRDRPFDFKDQHDFDLHVSLLVDESALQAMMERARARGVECRGIADHGFIRSIYLRDPNGYVVELAAKTDRHDIVLNPARNSARAVLAEWQAGKLGLNPVE
jgi:catechol 2,3-dioxygenase-like lactoylglutathione lyase family enzyme